MHWMMMMIMRMMSNMEMRDLICDVINYCVWSCDRGTILYNIRSLYGWQTATILRHKMKKWTYGKNV